MMKEVSKDGLKQGRPCKVQQPLKSTLRWGIANVIWETVSRSGKPDGADCFPPEETKITIMYLELIEYNGTVKRPNPCYVMVAD